MCKVLEGFRLEFLAGVPKHAGKAVVDPQARSVGTDQDNAHCCIFECRTEPRLAFDKRVPRLNLFRYDFSKQERAANIAVGSAPGHHGPAHPVGVTVIARVLILVLRQLLTGQHAGMNVAPALRDVGKDLVMRPAYELCAWGKVVDNKLTRDRKVAHMAIEHGNRCRGVVDKRSQLRLAFCERLFGPLAFADIDQYVDRTGHSSCFIE